jgi:hypothetical protein
MSVEAKLKPSIPDVMEVVAVLFGPNDIEPSTRTGTEASVDRDIQFDPWIKPITEIVMSSQWLILKENIPDGDESIMIPWAGVA